MTTWIALLRGINVGGKNRLPMKDLVSYFEGLNCRNVRTYIQSGNVVFESASRSAASLSRRIATAIEGNCGFRPHTFVLREKDLKQAISVNPYPEAVSDPKSLHFFFLDEPADPACVAELDRIKAKGERFELTDQVLYLHTPKGFAHSKLAVKAERLLKVNVTARNFRTVENLFEMTNG